MASDLVELDPVRDADVVSGEMLTAGGLRPESQETGGCNPMFTERLVWGQQNGFWTLVCSGGQVFVVRHVKRRDKWAATLTGQVAAVGLRLKCDVLQSRADPLGPLGSLAGHWRHYS